MRLHYSSDIKNILNLNYQEAIFFNFGWDFITPFILSKINSKRVIYINFYKEKLFKKNIQIKQFFQMFIYRVLYKNLKIQIEFDGKFKKLFFFPTNKKIYYKNPTNKITKPIFQLPSLKNKKKIIYTDGGEESLKFKGYKKILLNVFSIIEKKGYSILIKKHPQNKLSIKNYKTASYIIDPMPIELYNMSDVKYVFGFLSTSLAKIANNFPNIKVFSIMDLILLQTGPLRKKNYIYKKYLNNMTRKNKVHYPFNLNQITEMLND